MLFAPPAPRDCRLRQLRQLRQLPSALPPIAHRQLHRATGAAAVGPYITALAPDLLAWHRPDDWPASLRGPSRQTGLP